MKKTLSILLLLCFILSLAACGEKPFEGVKKTTPQDGETAETSVTVTDNSEIITSDTENSTESSTQDATQTMSTDTNSNTPVNNSSANSTDETGSKPTNPPASGTPSQSPSKPPEESKPPASTPSEKPSEPPPATSTPPVPEYEIMGQDYINGVLKGMNDRRAALGFPLAKLDSALSNECLVQAKKMADAGYDYHSEHPTGCEGTAKVPYNFPAELMGDMMCNHVADFTYEATTKIGIAVVKKNNSLFVVVQGTA